MSNRNECDNCGLAACDLPDGVDPEFIFEREGDQVLCQGCKQLRNPWHSR